MVRRIFGVVLKNPARRAQGSCPVLSFLFSMSVSRYLGVPAHGTPQGSIPIDSGLAHVLPALWFNTSSE